MRTLLTFALLLLAVPAAADDAFDRSLADEYLKRSDSDKVASDDYGEYYMNSGDIWRHPGYVMALYDIIIKNPDEKGYLLSGTYKFDCRGKAQMMDGGYSATVTTGSYGPYLGTTGEEERPDSHMKPIDNPSIAAMEKYACK